MSSWRRDFSAPSECEVCAWWEFCSALAGVGVLAGVNPVGGLPAVVGIIATTTASFLYAGGTLYTQIRLDKVSPILVAFATSLGGAILLIPWAAVEAPSSAPSWKVIGAVVALAVFGTALAQIIFYRMLPLFGSTRSSLIAYLVPPVALIYGTLILDEPLTLNALLGARACAARDRPRIWHAHTPARPRRSAGLARRRGLM